MTDKEQEELDQYLKDEYNYETYKEFLYTDYKGLFEPLEYFRLFYQQLEFIRNNKSKPFYVVEKLNELELNDKQKSMLLRDLKAYLYGSNDRQIEICCLQIQGKIDLLDSENEIKEANIQNEKFEKVLQHLETLPDYKEKIAFLTQEKTNYEQSRIGSRAANKTNFSQKIDLEIKKLKELRNLEIIRSKSESNLLEENKQKHKDLTLDRAVLFFYYLFKYQKLSFDNKQKAKVISFLTGYSANTLEQQFSQIHKKANTNFSNYEKDMQIVRNQFEILGLTEVTKMIDNDLADQENRTEKNL